MDLKAECCYCGNICNKKDMGKDCETYEPLCPDCYEDAYQAGVAHDRDVEQYMTERGV